MIAKKTYRYHTVTAVALGAALAPSWISLLWTSKDDSLQKHKKK